MSIELKNVYYFYGRDSKNMVTALEDISFRIDNHEYVGIIGHTGSGKSTLVQHMNGLNLPSEGTVTVDSITTTDKNADLRALRQRVGLVFQYPEDQLFEETIYKDIAFGPKNLGLSEEEIDRRVRSSMEAVGLSFAELKDASPFEISGGQKRRVAIAGVLALNPSYLVLDEPTAGLDPMGREDILSTIRTLYEKNPEMTILLVTHSMEDIAENATRIMVIDKGRLVMDDTPKEVFAREEELEAIGLTIPQVTKFMKKLNEKGYDVDPRALSVEEALQSILSMKGSKS